MAKKRQTSLKVKASSRKRPGTRSRSKARIRLETDRRQIRLEASRRKPTHQRSRTKSRKRSHQREDTSFEHTATKFVDQASQLIKTGITMGIESAQRGRQMIKRGATEVVDGTAHGVGRVVGQGSRAIKKNVIGKL
jgi:hypothetical protein